MTKPMVRIYDVANNEIIDREMTDEEFAQHQIDLAEAEAKNEAENAKAIAKANAQAKLAALGLDLEDLQALGL